MIDNNLLVTELITKRNAMGKQIITFINNQMQQFTNETGVDVVDIQLSVLDASEHDKAGHFVDRVYILLDI